MHNDNEPIIEVRGLWKRYGLPPFFPWQKQQTLEHEWALRDISFSVPRGGSLGILGRNGAGKSTLLKLLAGVTPPDKGEVIVRGKMFPMIELTAGMSMELSGRENIGILGTIMGLSSKEIERIIPEVEDFSELEDWIYKPVWQYSSGMLVKLAFAIAVNVQADILLVDEILSVGDILFTKKCDQKVRQLMDMGVTLLFVSHSPHQVERLCQHGMILENKQLVHFSDSTSALQEYLYRCGLVEQPVESKEDCLPAYAARQGTGDLRITAIEILNSQGQKSSTLTVGESISIVVHYETFDEVKNWNISIRILDKNHEVVALVAPSPEECPALMASQKGTMKATFSAFPLVGEKYCLTVMVATNIIIDLVERVVPFSISHTQESVLRTGNVGHLYLKAEWAS